MRKEEAGTRLFLVLAEGSCAHTRVHISPANFNHKCFLNVKDVGILKLSTRMFWFCYEETAICPLPSALSETFVCSRGGVMLRCQKSPGRVWAFCVWCHPHYSLCSLYISGHMLASAPDTEEFSTNWMGQEVTGATLGIIGMGSIGYKVAQRARAFEMKILYRNRRRR